VNLSSHLMQRVLRLDPPLTRDLVVERDLRVPMPDGAVLLADRYLPRAGDQALPVALLRSPYGRRGLIAAGMARPLAERGFQVLMQSTRGTFGSGGSFDPMRCEREDGLATLEWVVKQPWFGGSIVLVGGSYLGYVQWAVADRLPPEVKAMIPQVTDSALTLEFLRKDGLSLETPFSWGVMVAGQERRMGMLRGLVQVPRTRRALSTLPLGRADVVAIGHRSDYVRDIIADDADDARWAGIDHRHRVAEVSVPVSSIGGWYDIFLPGQLRDFRILQEAGRPARLTVGPWTHISADGTPLRESIEFGLTYTTAPLENDVEVIGEVSAEIWFGSSLPYADVFVRLCDVDPRGRSRNVCDGLVSLSGADDVSCAAVRLWPTAHRFMRGHRIRLQVSSGAFPRYARNHGTGEPRATATRLLPADQAVYHDEAHPSAVVLPVRQAQ